MPDRVPPAMVRYRPYRPPLDAPAASSAFHSVISQRRSVREFSDRPVAREAIENLIRAAGTAGSGANKQPWRFVAVQDPALKREIRLAAEEEEREFYLRRASERWIEDLYPLGTDERKEFLETAPCKNGRNPMRGKSGSRPVPFLSPPR